MRKFWLFTAGALQVLAAIAVFLFIRWRETPKPVPPPAVVVGEEPHAPRIAEETHIYEVPAPAPAPRPFALPAPANAATSQTAPAETPAYPAPSPTPSAPGPVAPSSSAPVDGKLSIAVMPITIIDGATNTRLNNSLGEQYAGRIEGNIDIGKFRIFDRDHVPDLLKEASLANSDLSENDGKAAAVLRLHNVQQLVLGKAFVYRNDQGRLVLSEIQVKREDCRTGEVLGRGATTEDANSGFTDLAVQLGLRTGAAAAPGGAGAAPHADGGLINQINLQQQFHLNLRTADGKAIYEEGDYVTFEVTADVDCYVTLLTQDPSGEITMLLPNRWKDTPEAQFIAAGQVRRIPWEGAGFRFPIQPPHGRTVVRAVASRNKPLKIRGADQDAIRAAGFLVLNKDRAGGKGIGVEADITSNSVPNASRPPDAIDGQLNALPADQWTTAEVILTTRPRKSPEPPAPSVAPAPPAPTTNMAQAPVPTPPAPPQPTPPTPPAPVANGDANDQLLDRWNKLSAENPVASAMHLEMNHPSGGSKGLGEDQPETPAPTELLVFRKSRAGGKGLGDGGGDNVAGSLLGDMQVAPVGGKGLGDGDINDRIDAIMKDPDVVAVVPNLPMHSFDMPTTPLIGVQWALRNDISAANDTGWSRISDQVANIKTPLIGLVDQGMNLDDPRLAPLAWTNPGEIPGNGKDDDGNGLIDDVHGYNFVDESAVLFDPKLDYNHGSMCASIIGGRATGHPDDVIGIAPNAKIVCAVVMSVKPGQGEGAHGDLKAILRGIDYCASCGAKVINLSLGGPITQKQYEALDRLPIWDALEKRGVILVCAAGNDFSDDDRVLVCPASIRRSNIVTVMAVDPAGKLARALDSKGKWFPFSNYGAKSVQIAAPGSLILGAPTMGKAKLDFGTSFSAPIVTGALALVMGKHKDWTYRQAISAIMNTARPVDELQGKCVSGGTLDIDAALNWTP